MKEQPRHRKYASKRKCEHGVLLGFICNDCEKLKKKIATDTCGEFLSKNFDPDDLEREFTLAEINDKKEKVEIKQIEKVVDEKIFEIKDVDVNEDFSFTEEEIKEYRRLENCPFCHRKFVEIQVGIFLAKPNKRYRIFHHCSTLKTSITTEYCTSLNELVNRWNGEF